MHTDRVLTLARAAAEAADVASLIDVGLPVVLEAAQATTVALCRSEGDELVVEQRTGEPLTRGPGTEQHELPGRLGVLVVAWSGERAPGPQHELALVILLGGIKRLHEAAERAELVVRSATVREDRDALTASLGEARLRRRHALEINDNVVQGLVAASYALDARQHPLVATYLQQTLAAARGMMNDLLLPLAGEDIVPGDLVRRAAAPVGKAVVTPLEPPPDDTGHRVLLVDDAEDVRLLTRTYLNRSPGLSVVGEAGDGISAIEQARVLQPDLVLLDMAMPRMDGLEALPHIKEAVPGVQVIVFSGFDEVALADKARQAGADGYAVKGGSMKDLVAQVNAHLKAG